MKIYKVSLADKLYITCSLFLVGRITVPFWHYPLWWLHPIDKFVNKITFKKFSLASLVLDKVVDVKSILVRKIFYPLRHKFIWRIYYPICFKIIGHDAMMKKINKQNERDKNLRLLAYLRLSANENLPNELDGLFNYKPSFAMKQIDLYFQPNYKEKQYLYFAEIRLARRADFDFRHGRKISRLTAIKKYCDQYSIFIPERIKAAKTEDEQMSSKVEDENIKQTLNENSESNDNIEKLSCASNQNYNGLHIIRRYCKVEELNNALCKELCDRMYEYLKSGLYQLVILQMDYSDGCLVLVDYQNYSKVLTARINNNTITYELKPGDLLINREIDEALEEKGYPKLDLNSKMSDEWKKMQINKYLDKLKQQINQH